MGTRCIGGWLGHLNAEQAAELRRLHDINVAAIQYCAGIEPQFASSAAGMQSALASTLAAGDLRGMRIASRDIREMTTALSSEQQRELRAHVLATSGHPFDAK